MGKNASSDVRDAFLTDWAALSAIGETKGGGVERQAASQADNQTRAWLCEWLKSHEATVRIDRIGNVFGVIEFGSDLPYLLVGSHLDSQPNGGKFDGAYGVLAAAYAAIGARTRLVDEGIAPLFNIAIVDWFNEEGSRFKPSMMGSGVFTGKLALEAALAVADGQGVTVRSALESGGYLGEDFSPLVAAYCEIHIEQGPHLELEAIDMGVVDRTWAARKYDVSVTGEQAHTGATPMAMRRDALAAAAAAIVELYKIANLAPNDSLHTSVGELFVIPNSPVVVASGVEFLADLRSLDAELLQNADSQFRDACTRIEGDFGVTVRLHLSHTWETTRFDEDGALVTEEIVSDLGYTHRRMATIAGHDATNFVDVVPTSLLFVPSVGGITHNERELTKPDDLVAGVKVLTELLFRTAQSSWAGPTGIGRAVS